MQDKQYQGQYSEKVMEHFMHPQNVGDMPDADGTGHVGNPVCVVGDTLICANDDTKNIKDIKPDERVLSHDGRYHRVTKTYARPYKGRLLSVVTHSLGSTFLTPEHHVLAIKTYGYPYKMKFSKENIPDWYLAEQLEKGDIIPYPIPQEEVDTARMEFDIDKPKWDHKSKELPCYVDVDEDFSRLVGYYLSEGYVRTDKCKGTVGFVFNSKETEYKDDVINLMNKTFGFYPKEIRIVRNAVNITYYSARLAKFFEKHFGKGAINKRVPHWMTLLPPDKQKSILCGLWRGDGCVNDKGAKFVTISKQLAYQARSFLLCQKIIFSFLKVNAIGIHKENYHIYVKEENSLKALAKIVGAEVRRPAKKLNTHKSWYDEKYFYSTIGRIDSKNFSGLVYNLEVKKTKSYITNSAILHNCGDIMELYIKVKNDIIIDAKFKTFGCGAAIATSSMVTELVKGKTIKEALDISNRAVAEALGGLPKIKMHCSVLAEQALRSAIIDFLKKQNRLEEFPSLKDYNPDDANHEHESG